MTRDRDADAGRETSESGSHTRQTEPRTTRTTAEERGPDVGIRQARERFGGFDVPATLVGMLTALALLALLGGLITAAIGAIGYQTGLEGNEEELSMAGLIGGALTLFLAFLVGGWAAARIARYDGPRNGLMTGVWTLILAAVVSALAALLGDKYDILSRIELPQWFSRDALTTSAIVSGIVAIGSMLLGGLLGGMWGERYHRRADAAIARPERTVRRERGVEQG